MTAVKWPVLIVLRTTLSCVWSSTRSCLMRCGCAVVSHEVLYDVVRTKGLVNGDVTLLLSRVFGCHQKGCCEDTRFGDVMPNHRSST